MRDAATARLRRNFNATGAGALVILLLPALLTLLLSRFPLPPESRRMAAGFASVPAFLLSGLLVTVTLRLSPRQAFSLAARLPVAGPFNEKPPAGPARRLLLPGIFCCLGMSVVGVNLSRLLTLALERWAGCVPVMPRFAAPQSGWEAVLYIVRLALLPALLEEAFFRGAVLTALKPCGTRTALVAASLLFALAHGNLVQAPNAFVTGLVLGYFALKSGGLLVPMAMHLANNGLAALATLAGLILSPRDYDLLTFLITPACLVLGFAGVMLLILCGQAVLPLADASGLTARQKLLAFVTSPMAMLFLAVSIYQMMRAMETV